MTVYVAIANRRGGPLKLSRKQRRRMYKTREEIAEEMRALYVAYDKAQGARALAKQLRTSEVAIRLVMCGRRPPTNAMLRALGYDTTPRFCRVA